MIVRTSQLRAAPDSTQPNILIFCMDQWDARMKLPPEVDLPALRRLERDGVSLDNHYCTVPVCTPSRAAMWTGIHAKQTGLWDNTNFAWIRELLPTVPTIGHMLREYGYYTAFKGKWHCSEVEKSEDALERYGFSDYQQWGEMFGAPLQGEQLDGAAAFQAVDWLETKATRLNQVGQPWLLVCSLVNPHDIMFLQTDPIEKPHPKGAMTGLQTASQRLGWFEQKWNISLPENFDDDLTYQPYGVRHYKELTELNYGRVPDNRTDLWLARRNYLVNAMRLVDAQFARILDALDRLNLWQNTIVIFTCDHGEMNGAHRMTQKGAIAFDEAVAVNFIVCVPDGPRGERTAAVGSHLDLAPTVLAFAGLSDDDIRARHPQLKGRSLKNAILNPYSHGPRGSRHEPGDGALICWDGLHALDKDWVITGALKTLTEMGLSGPHGQEEGRTEKLSRAGETFGAPDFSKRTFFRAVVDGRYKLVRWFSPEQYSNPSTLDELFATSDIGLYDLINDPGELENIGHPDHPDYDESLVERMLQKLHKLVREEIGEDRPPFDLNLFGTREVIYHRQMDLQQQREAASRAMRQSRGDT